MAETAGTETALAVIQDTLACKKWTLDSEQSMIQRIKNVNCGTMDQGMLVGDGREIDSFDWVFGVESEPKSTWSAGK